MADGQVVFEITADDKHAIASVKDVTKAIESESKKWDSAAKDSTGGIENSFASMAKKVAAGFSAMKVAQTLVSWGNAAVQAASDLAEVQNVVDTVFGDNANQIESWAKKAGQQFGLTETQAKKFTSTLGAMMKSSGMAGPEIVNMSTDLAGLAADMASFYNLDFETAFQKIRSGISGETEPLKQLGINMSVANLEAYALTQGISKAFNEMSQGEQTMLRYQYLMQATADAQGDFAKTADGFANAQRRIEAAFDTINTVAGSFLLTTIEPLVSGFAGLLETISTPAEPTILDEFKDIDLNTAEKIQSIEEAAEKARELTGVLDDINNHSASANVQKLISDIGEIKLDEGKPEVLNRFLSTLRNNVSAISEMTGKDAEGAKAWIEEVATAANSLDPASAQGWSDFVALIKEGLPGIEDTENGQSVLSALSGDFAAIGSESAQAGAYLEALGIKTDGVADKNELWLATCKELVKTIPGLSSIINTETGEVKGGTQAILDYVDAWEAGQKKLAYLQMHEQKGSLLEQEFSDLKSLKLQMDLAGARIDRRLASVKDIYDKYGLSYAFDRDGNLDLSEFNDIYGGITKAEREALNKAREDIKRDGLGAAYTAAVDAYQARKADYDLAKEIYTEEGELIEEMAGEVENATDAVREWSDATKQAGKDAVAATQEALTSLANYVKGVRDATEQAVNSVASGFKNLQRPTTELEKKRDELIQKQQKVNQSTKEGEKEYQKLEEQIKELNKQIDVYSPKGMMAGLESQKAFMNEYISNLRKAQSMGLSNELLASLSDGSLESAEYLMQLVSNPEMAKEVDALYQEVNGLKGQFTDTLTQQKLTVDDTYNAMVEKAKESIAAMDLGEEAQKAMGDTVAGLAQGINANVDGVSAAVDSILAELNRLNGFGVSIDLGSFGSFGFQLGNVLDGEHATGLDYVPFDGYLAGLHEGEGILTAEENRIWQRFKNGSVASQNVDYDALGGVMRENVRPGGDVYLNGRIVGEVISAQQGNSYRSLKRSGWQG